MEVEKKHLHHDTQHLRRLLKSLVMQSKLERNNRGKTKSLKVRRRRSKNEFKLKKKIRRSSEYDCLSKNNKRVVEKMNPKPNLNLRHPNLNLRRKLQVSVSR